jgi:hypothetical protein
MERTYVVHTDGYFQEVTGKVDPLPFHGMSNYPYPESEHYPDDQEHQDYLEQWNTRVHTRISAADTDGVLSGAVASLQRALAEVWEAGETFVAALFEPSAGSGTVVASAAGANLHYSVNTDRLSLDLGGTTGAVTRVTAAEGWQGAVAPAGTMPAPSAPGTPADASSVQKTASQDSQYWITDASTSDHGFNYQIARFHIDPATKPTLTSVGVSWYGHGDPTSGYPTSIYVWNFKTSKWDSIASLQSPLNGNSAGALARPTSIRQAECLRCHGVDAPPAGVTVPSGLVKVGASWVTGINETHGGGGTTAPYDCTVCHTPHVGGGTWKIASTINCVPVTTPTTSNQMKNVCAACHGTDVYANHATCNACHNDPDGVDWHGFIAPTYDGTSDCLACHGHGKQFVHPYARHCTPYPSTWNTF